MQYVVTSVSGILNNKVFLFKPPIGNARCLSLQGIKSRWRKCLTHWPNPFTLKSCYVKRSLSGCVTSTLVYLIVLTTQEAYHTQLSGYFLDALGYLRHEAYDQIVMDDLPTCLVPEIDQKSENMRGLINRAMEAFLPRRKGSTNNSVAGSQSRTGRESIPCFPAQHMKGWSGLHFPCRKSTVFWKMQCQRPYRKWRIGTVAI